MGNFTDKMEESQEKQYCESVKKLWEMRTGYSISQERLAKRCGISRQYLNEIENYKKEAPDRLIQKLCMAIRQEAGEEALEIILDYFRVRIPTQEVRLVIEGLLHMRMEHFWHEDYGFYGYAEQYVFGDITVMTSPKKENGTLIELKGKGCRQFERILTAQERSWYEFLRDVINQNGVFKRVDIAINDRFGMLDIQKLTDKRIRGEYGGRLRKFQIEQSGRESKTREQNKMEMGQTLYLGSLKSDIYFCIYEKDYEQMIKAGIPITEAEIKNRFEIRLKDDRAGRAISDLTEQEKPALTAFGIINHYAWFLKPEKGKKRESWEKDRDWLTFIGNEERDLKLTMKPEPYAIDRSKKWYSHQVAPTMKMFQKLDELQGTNFLEGTLAETKLKEKHEKIIKAITTPIEDIIF